MTAILTRPVVSIEGDRQTGKTETLLRIGASEFLAGNRILWVSSALALARNDHMRMLEYLDGEWSRRTSGAANLTITGDRGGEIRFITGRIPGAGRGVEADVLILDDAHEYEGAIDSLMYTLSPTAPFGGRAYVARVTKNG